MTKQEKIALVQELTEKFQEFPNFYIADAGGLTVAEMNELRQLCFESNVKLQVVKNTLIKKALDNLEGDYSEVYDVLNLPSSVFFVDAENPSVPAKLLKKFRESKDKPVLKAAVIETSVFKGDDQLKALADLKSKDELIGEIVGLLQSPAKNVISALTSGGGKLAGILKTLSEREE
ncbi:50S ribosomal protein L10 [Pontibacter sp. G13]|uniref:50S ribosomal protein L10 n=1 Tax=Pontibacter sp. G13 TaxID=3074898 RepID=UPI00288C4A2C|nr:50S ribosomal protein L10 [Pontibacter sp. G13]WNJ16923.1 50S ribosomal protein L10 [Pontibacter sp. G13]